eukprot:TRINITY_DN6371_c0_g1_i1.p1 TRINITY_DN6371_c0_g1~~TRINITY_DN6371_c0_g1_i1.p1  ORF type:complete len:502 (+),score=92.05 TRINITY_DN6371_c0_g1_i1:43-1548(+)
MFRTTSILTRNLMPSGEWHVRGGHGGTKIESSATSNLQGLEAASLKEVLCLQESVAATMNKTHISHKIISAAIEKAAVLNRKWSDEAFHEGEEGNESRVHSLEAEFKAYYDKTGSLHDPVTLGFALDLVGAYLKNYKVAKASAIMDEAMPICRKKGGVWLIKGLNHTSTVRMKQQRHEEALAMLREMENCIPFKPEESVELHDILYRNIGMALQALGNSEAALPYFLKCAELKGVATWWDRWDVGYCIASVAFTSNDAKLLRKAAKTISEAIPLHSHAEPGDFVMHAKIHQAAADCYLALATLSDSTTTPVPDKSALPNSSSTSGKVNEQLERQTGITALSGDDDVPSLSKPEYLTLSTKHYKVAHQLFTEHCGHTNDLSGWCAAAVALSLVQQSEWKEAIHFLVHAIYVYSRSDIPRLSQLATNLDLVLQCHNQLQDPEHLNPLLPHLSTLIDRIESPNLKDPEGHVMTIKKIIAVLFMASDVDDFTKKGVTLLQECSLS